MKLTPEEAQAIVNLQQSQDFRVFLGFYAKFADTQQLLFIDAPPDRVHVHQGRVQALTQLAKFIGDARKMVDKYNSTG